MTKWNHPCGYNEHGILYKSQCIEMRKKKKKLANFMVN